MLRILKEIGKFLALFLAINAIAFSIYFFKTHPEFIPHERIPEAQTPTNENLQATASEDEFQKTKTYGVLDCNNFQNNPLVGPMFQMINADRIKNNAKALNWNPKLCESAKLKANDMVQNSYFEHVSPTFVTPWHWMDVVGYKYSLSEENLAMNAMTAESAHTGFMNSPGHRANILNPEVEEIGIAYDWGKINGQDAFFIVEHFSTPLTAANTKTKIICTDKSVAENNLKILNKQKDQIEEYLDDAEDIYADLKSKGLDTKKVTDYINDLKNKQKEINKQIKENKDYLNKCDN